MILLCLVDEPNVALIVKLRYSGAVPTYSQTFYSMLFQTLQTAQEMFHLLYRAT